MARLTETTRITRCANCDREIAQLRSRRTGRFYMVNIGRIVVDNEETGRVAEVDVAAFHDCPRPDALENREFPTIMRLFDTAMKSNAKRMRIALATEQGDPVLLKFTKGNPKVHITNGEAYGSESNVYYGALLIGSGAFAPARAAHMGIVGLLEKLNADPEGAAAAYGRQTGNCSFCSKALEDDRSLEVGYGPKCAKNYGLRWGNRPAAAA